CTVPDAPLLRIRSQGRCGRAALRSRDLALAVEARFRLPHPLLGLPEAYRRGSAWLLPRGGCELAMACDITIAAESAVFGERELRFGSVITALMMPWLVGPKRTNELLLTGQDRISAASAEKIGLSNRTVSEARASASMIFLGIHAAFRDLRVYPWRTIICVKSRQRAVISTYDYDG